MPEARGLSKNTINSYKTTFTLLIKYMYSVKNMKADEITFDCVLVKLFGNTLFGNHALYRNSIGVI